MSVRKPLSYGNFKSIIQHLYPNLRIKISERCPSLRIVEKLKPMALHYLEIDPGSYRVENLTYQLQTTIEGDNDIGFLEQYRGEQTFITDDINRFGLPNYAEDDILEAGDIRIPGEDMEDYQARREAIEADMRERAELLAETQDGEIVRDLVPNVQYGLRFSVWKKRTMIRKEEMEKEPKRIRHALSYLADKLFGGRTELFVRILKINDNTGVYRFPCDFRVRIRRLKIEYNASAVLNAIAPIIDKRSFPLEHICIDGYFEDVNVGNYVHPYIENAKMCTIAQERLEDSDDSPPPMRMVDAMLATRCKIVALDCNAGELTEAMVQNIMDSLLTASPPKKIHLRVQSMIPARVQAFHRMLGAMHGGLSKQIGYYWCNEFPTAIIFQVDSSRKLLVYCMHNKKYDTWQLHFNVVTNERYIYMKMQF